MDDLSEKRDIIRNNYSMVVERIHKAARVADRNPDEIRLVVVTKTQSVEVIQYVIEAGANELGENYVEEAAPKIQALSNNQKIQWHMIGHIQSRKAQSVCEYFQYVHSLDSLKLAERLSRFAVELTKVIPVYMEFNIGGEESKSGWNITQKENWGNILSEIARIFSLPGLNCLGVMTIPPYFSNPDEGHPFYHRLREFQLFIINNLQLSGFREMSIGMSSDFEVAIQEGSTCVRIGQAILGPRPG